MTNGAKWTLSGVLLPEEGRQKKTKCKVSKRMRYSTYFLISLKIPLKNSYFY